MLPAKLAERNLKKRNEIWRKGRYVMENLIWLVVIGALFFLMMRKGGGCCGGHSHGSHKEHDEQEHSSASKPDNGKKAGCH